MSKYNVGLRTLLLHGLSEPEFYGGLVHKFRKIIGKNDFPYHFKKIIVRYKKIGYNLDVLRQTASLVVHPIKVNSSAYLFNGIGRSGFRLNDGTILNLTYEFNWWVSFALEFQCCYFCESSCLIYLSFNFDFYVTKIMHL